MAAKSYSPIFGNLELFPRQVKNSPPTLFGNSENWAKTKIIQLLLSNPKKQETPPQRDETSALNILCSTIHNKQRNKDKYINEQNKRNRKCCGKNNQNIHKPPLWRSNWRKREKKEEKCYLLAYSRWEKQVGTMVRAYPNSWMYFGMLLVRGWEVVSRLTVKKKGEAICQGKVFFKYPFVFAFLLNSSTPLRVNMVRPWTVSCVQLLDCLFAVFEPRTPPHASSLHSRFSFSVFVSLPKYLTFILLLQSVPNCFAPETKPCPIPLE